MTEMEVLGSMVGRIRVVDFLGEGGMGAVFVGFDEKLQRRVALKVLREGRLDATARARFLREARVLSQLKHPHICEIYDYVEGEERDFLVLELVEGRSLKEVIAARPDYPTQLRIATQLVEALAAAHAKGIIHRDLKPSNVLVTPAGGVKVLDFGLARTTTEDAPTLDATAPSTPDGRNDSSDYIVTKLGALVGTLAYMSPEQARGEPLTTASDMYSYGLVVQELFTGRPAYEAGLDATTHLAKARAGETVPVVGLPADVAALINRLKSPAQAVRPSALDAAERLAWIKQKPRRRMKRVVISAAVSAAVIVAAGMSYQAYRVRQEAERAHRASEVARREAATAQQVSAFLVGLFEVSDPSKARGNSVTAREILDRGSERIEAELKEQPLVRARLMETMGSVYSNLGLFDEAESLLRTALRLREEQQGGDAAEVGRVLSDLAKVQAQSRGDLEGAERLLRRAIRIEEEASGSDSPQLALYLSRLSIVLRTKGDYEEAKVQIKRTLAIQERQPDPEGERLGTYLGNLATICLTEGNYSEAEALLRRALAIKEKAHGPDDPSSTFLLHNLALAYESMGNYDQAEAFYRRALSIDERTLGPAHPDVAHTLSSLGGLLQVRGMDKEAEIVLQRALAIQQEALEPDHLDLAFTLCYLARAHLRLGRLDEAEPEFNRAVGIAASHPLTEPGDALSVKVDSLRGLARIHEERGRDQKVTDIMSEVVRTVEPHVAKADEDTLALLVQALLQLGCSDRAAAVAAEFLPGGYENEKLKELRRDLGLPPVKQ